MKLTRNESTAARIRERLGEEQTRPRGAGAG